MTSREPYTQGDVIAMLDESVVSSLLGRIPALTEVFNILLEKYGTTEEAPSEYWGAVQAAQGHMDLDRSATRIRELRGLLKEETQKMSGLLTWENHVNRVSEVKLAGATRMSRTTIRALLRSGPPREERR